MNLILSRHGNTFGPNDPVVWAGITNDLPLTEKGFEQAENLASALQAKKVRPVAIFCSPLQRTSQYASTIIEKLGLPDKAIVDSRLNEIDYGEWTGLTHEQVIARFGESAIREWDEHSRWPSQGRWGGSEASVIAETGEFVRDLISRYADHETLLAITSNGRLRYFLTLIEGEFNRRAEKGTFKVKTGHICKITDLRYSPSIEYWNLDPRSIDRL